MEDNKQVIIFKNKFIMEFKKIQDYKTGKIIMYFVDNKRVTEQRYEDKFSIASITGTPNSFYTTRTKKGNFSHSFSV